MTIWLEATIDYSDNTCKILIQGEGSEHISYREMFASDLEDLESQLQSIASQIRDFRIKNFPESENIDL